MNVWGQRHGHHHLLRFEAHVDNGIKATRDQQVSFVQREGPWQGLQVIACSVLRPSLYP